MKAYCVKCRTQKDMKDYTAERFKDGHLWFIGKCPDCGARMFFRTLND